MRFAAAQYLGLLWAAPLLALLVWSGFRRRAALLRALGHHATIARMAAEVSGAKRVGGAALFLAAFAAASVALARPQFGLRSELRPSRGVDLVVAVDVSRSMMAADVPPSRLRKAKVELRALLEKLSGDRVAIVPFAGMAFVQCPLTADYAAAAMFLDAVGPDTIPVPGTNLAAAVELGTKVLADGGNPSKVLILLTDGEDNEGQGLEAAKAAAAAGVTIYAVGVGTPGGEPIPLADERGEPKGFRKDKMGAVILSRLDEAGLKAIAEAAKGKYFPSRGTDIGVERVHQEIASLEKKEFDRRVLTIYDERYQYLLLPALLLLAAEFILGDRKGPARRRAPEEGDEAGDAAALKAGAAK